MPLNRTFFAILLAILTLTPAIQSQTDSPAAESNMYALALKASVHEMEAEYAHIDDSNNGQFQRTDYRRLVVQMNAPITEGLPDQFGDHHVEYMDDNAIIARYKMLGKSFPVFTISPMKNAEGRLKIVMTRTLAGVEKHRLMLAISDWSTVWFAYNCGQREFAIDSVKLGGV